MRIAFTKSSRVSWLRTRLWAGAWTLAALAYAAPLAWNAYDDLVQVGYQTRARLIEQHRLWEVDNIRGKPQGWIRFASRNLTDRQLLRRVATKYGAQSEEIERDYRRDLAIARGEIVVIAFTLWAAPLGALYGLVALVRRRRPSAPAPKAEPASASDPRYLPPT